MNQEFRDWLKTGEQMGSRYRLAVPPRLPIGSGGTALGRRAGRSLEFLDYRAYQPGDDLRHLDWNAFARSDRLTVKMFREEVNPHLDLLLDGSASMSLPGSRKAEATLGLAALLSRSAGNAGFTWRSWQAADGVHPIPNGHTPPINWEGLDFSWRTGMEASFRRLPPAWKPRGIRIVVSDLLWPGDPSAALWPITSGSAMTVVIQMISSIDRDGPPIGALRLLDSETGEQREVLVEGGAIARYREAFTRHQQAWEEACRRQRAVFLPMTAEEFLQNWDLRGLLAQEILRIA